MEEKTPKQWFRHFYGGNRASASPLITDAVLHKATSPNSMRLPGPWISRLRSQHGTA